VLIPSAFVAYLILDFGLGMNGSMAQAVGKDPTLTDRTRIWGFLLGMHTNAWLGTGYQSFWLGSRLETFWQGAGLGHLNEAHNGYLEVYLDLGLTGCALLSLFLMSGYRKICKGLETSPRVAIFGLAVWLAMVFYNMSEAAFENGLLYSTFLLVAIAPMRCVPNRVRMATSERSTVVARMSERRTAG
jgi:exopolysaccharide production protein ExoQ